MEFRDAAIDATTGQPREGYAVGACYISEDGAWRLSATDPARPAASEWQVWQHVDGASQRDNPRNWQRRLSWVRLPHPDAAKAAAVVLAALPAAASWEAARLALRNAMRDAGAALFFRGVFATTRGAAALAGAVRRTTAPRTPSTADVPDGDPQDVGA